MATKRKNTKSGSKRGATKKKVGRKPASKSAYGLTRRKRAHVIGSSDGHVYIVAGPGDRPRQVHVAKKGTARDISRSIGLSTRQLSGARSLLDRLERAGLIRKI